MKLNTNSQAFMVARDRKIYLGEASSEGRCKDWIDGPSHPSIKRKNMSSDQKKIKVSGNDKPKFHPGSVSSSWNGLLNASNGNLTFKSLSDVYQNTQNTHAIITPEPIRVNIDIGSSSPFGEVKSSLNCDAALRTGLNLNRNGSRQTISEDFPKFNYIPCNTMYQSANVNISLARIVTPIVQATVCPCQFLVHALKNWWRVCLHFTRFVEWKVFNKLHVYGKGTPASSLCVLYRVPDWED